MKLKILKNEHYIDIVNECDFEEGSTAFTASCFLNKNVEGEFKDFSLTEENESIAKVLLCSFEMLEQLKESLAVISWYMDNTKPEDNRHSDFFNIGMNQRQVLEELILKATE